jgi:hypothetical protein
MACPSCDHEWRELENWTPINRLKEWWNRGWLFLVTVVMWAVVAFVVGFLLVYPVVKGFYESWDRVGAANMLGLATLLGAVLLVMWLIIRIKPSDY